MKLLIFTLLLTVFFYLNASAARIRISNISDLDFGTTFAGDVALTIPAGTTETAKNGSFRVSGDANRAYTIVLPTSARIKTNGNGVITINISNFTSYPLPGANGLLSSAGVQNVYVGATRAALPANQKFGNYSGTYSITVVY